MLLLLHSLLSECQLASFFPSRPHSSPLFTAASPFLRHTPHCQHSSSPGCLCECCLLSWHLESQIHIWKQSLGQNPQCGIDTIFSEFRWQILTDLYGFFKHTHKAILGSEKIREKMRTAKDIICWMREGVPKLALVQTHTESTPMSQDSLVAWCLMQPYFFQAQTASRHPVKLKPMATRKSRIPQVSSNTL